MGKPRILVLDGKVQRGVRDAERLTDAELAAALRREGVDDVAEVKRATIEATGEITVVRR